MQTAATELASSGLSEKTGCYLLPFTHQKSLSIKYSARSFPLNLFRHKQLWPSHYLVSAVPKCPWDYFCPLCQGRLPGYIRETEKTTYFTEKLQGVHFFFLPTKWKQNKTPRLWELPYTQTFPQTGSNAFKFPLINAAFLPTVPFPSAIQVHIQQLN